MTDPFELAWAMVRKEVVAPTYDDSVPPIWQTLAAIGESAPPDSFPDTTENEKLALLGATLLANLISQQKFEEPHIEWLDFMNFATEYGLAVKHQTRDDDICWNKVY